MSDCLDYSEDHSSAHHPPKSSPQVGSTQSEPDYQIETSKFFFQGFDASSYFLTKNTLRILILWKELSQAW